ncbi:MAG: heavy metal translocating P-type ATPase [Bacteriovoracia bacterium]
MKKEFSYYIKAMDCINEENDIRSLVKDFEGIYGLDFQLSKRRLVIQMDEAREVEFKQRIASKGYIAQPVIEKTGLTRFAEEIKLGISLVLAFAAELLSIMADFGPSQKYVVGAIALIAIFLSGFGVYKKGFLALFKLKLNINALMTIAVTGAFVIGEWPEAAMVSALFSIAEWIESKAVDRARGSIRKLLSILPEESEVKIAGIWKKMRTADVEVSSEIRVRPGERIPLDGLITEGASEIDQSPVTGESRAVERKVGDSIFAGSINLSGMLVFENSTVATNNTVSRIIELVENTQSKKAPIERFVDQFSKRYTPIVFFVSLAIVFVGPYVMGWTFEASIYKALVLLVIACPCALVISTPITIVSALTTSAKIGVLMKGGHAIERLHRLKAIALDKTGTITYGAPSLADNILVAKGNDQKTSNDLALGLSKLSDHPVSKAIAKGLESSSAGEIKDFTAIAGQGVSGSFEGKKIYLGNKKLGESLGVMTEEIAREISGLESRGRSVSLLIEEKKVIAIFGVTDKIKEGSSEAIKMLKDMGIHVSMLSGDNAKTANLIGLQAGISDVRGELLPKDKLVLIQELQQKFGPTGMTGDGINDAPALAQADLGFAMGKMGTDSAKETADVVIIGDDLRKIPETILLAHRTHSILWQNIVFAIGVKAVFLILTFLGLASMWMAVFADVGATLIVVFNGMRLLRSDQVGPLEMSDNCTKECC